MELKPLDWELRNESTFIHNIFVAAIMFQVTSQADGRAAILQSDVASLQNVRLLSISVRSHRS